jgi:hypothetical protein
VFLENGVKEWYRNRKKALERKWTISNGQIHVNSSGYIQVSRINTDGSITLIAYIRDGKRTDIPQEKRLPYKIIK